MLKMIMVPGTFVMVIFCSLSGGCERQLVPCQAIFSTFVWQTEVTGVGLSTSSFHSLNYGNNSKG